MLAQRKREQHFHVQLVLHKRWYTWDVHDVYSLLHEQLNGKRVTLPFWVSRLPFSTFVMVAVCPQCTIIIHKFALEEGALIDLFEVNTWAKSTVWSEYGLTMS